MPYFPPGVELNTISKHRTSLNEKEAIAVWLLRWSGAKQHTIAAQLGTNAGRIADVLNEKTHVGARLKAHKLRAG